MIFDQNYRFVSELPGKDSTDLDAAPAVNLNAKGDDDDVMHFSFSIPISH